MTNEIENVESKLQKRFAAPLPDHMRRRILFWHDPDAEFATLVPELSLPEGVRLLNVTECGRFETKRTLLAADPEHDYLVYDTSTFRSVQEDWLQDIRRYSERFSLDFTTMRLQELGLPDEMPLRRLVRQYADFLANKTRMAKLAGLGYDHAVSSETQLHLNLLAAMAGTKENNASGILRAVLSAGLQPDENAALRTLEKYGGADAFWELAARYTGYVRTGTADASGAQLPSLLPHVLLCAMAAVLPEQAVLRLGNLQAVSPAQRAQCRGIVNDWLEESDRSAFRELCRHAEQRLNLPQKLTELDMDALLAVDCVPCADECILQRLIELLMQPAPRALEAVKAIETRRTAPWYENARATYEGVYWAAQMLLFYQAHPGGFHHADAAALWQAYCKDYYQMDSCYRHFQAAFSKSLKNPCEPVEDAFRSLAERMEGLYKQWFLQEMGENWTALVREELPQAMALPELPQQTDFYRRRVSPLLENGRVYVIISDALRYETAQELAEQLTRETKGEASISAMQGVLPSITKFGMAALLPYHTLTLTDGLDALCDGLPTHSVAARARVLQAAREDSTAISYRDLLEMKQAQRRELVSGTKLVYIYHNAIDAVGDKQPTEDQVFTACETAISEIKSLVNRIVNELSGTQILITADHGFLYTRSALRETEKTAPELAPDTTLERGHRYLILEESAQPQSDNLLSVSLSWLNSALRACVPPGSVRIKSPGGGVNYVHGGAMPQELAVPVILFKNRRADSRGYVETSPVELQLASQTRRVSNSIFTLEFYQKQPAAGKRTPAAYTLCFVDAAGREISDRQTVIADRTASEAADRVFRVHFLLKSGKYRRENEYFLNITERDSGETQRIPFTIDIAFASDFDF